MSVAESVPALAKGSLAYCKQSNDDSGNGQGMRLGKGYKVANKFGGKRTQVAISSMLCK